MLILTHRKELRQQHIKLMDDLGVEARCEMIITESKNLRDKAPKLIIADEAHLSRSKSWETVIEHYNTNTVGFTATPVRLDSKPLYPMFDTLVQGVSTQWLIDNKRLADYIYYAPTVVETDELLVGSNQDYLFAPMEELMMERKVYSDVIESYRKLADGEKTIIFCVSIKHAEATAKRFREAGYPASSVSSRDKDRQKVFDEFVESTNGILCNVGIISEGISIDDVTCCMLLRPTESLALYIQQSMRCMRYLPNKTAKIIDCVANYTRHPLPSADIEWSLTEIPERKSNINPDGTFTIRTCLECYKIFETAPVCPYCGTEYKTTRREIQEMKSVELVEIKREESELAERARLYQRQEVREAKTLDDLWKIARARGYNPKWIYRMSRIKGIKK